MRIQHLLGGLILVGATLQVGCAAGATRAGMKPHFGPLKQRPETVAVAVTGGHGTCPLWMSNVSNEALEAALVDSIRETKVFAAVVPAAQANYVLRVTLVDLDRPFFGFSMTVTAQTSWVLESAETKEVIWRLEIYRAYTAKVRDTFFAIKRVRLANEGAVRAVIKAGLEQLAEADLKPAVKPVPVTP